MFSTQNFHSQNFYVNKIIIKNSLSFHQIIIFHSNTSKFSPLNLNPKIFCLSFFFFLSNIYFVCGWKREVMISSHLRNLPKYCACVVVVSLIERTRSDSFVNCWATWECTCDTSNIDASLNPKIERENTACYKYSTTPMTKNSGIFIVPCVSEPSLKILPSHSHPPFSKWQTRRTRRWVVQAEASFL